LRICDQDLFVCPPALHFFTSHVKDLVLPSHRTVEALWVECSNLFIDEMRSGWEIEPVVRLETSILWSAKHADLAARERQLRRLLRLRRRLGRRRSDRGFRMSR